MNMTQDTSRSTASQEPGATLRPSTFDSEHEHSELQRILSSNSHQVVVSAVPISSDIFEGSSSLPIATATSTSPVMYNTATRMTEPAVCHQQSDKANEQVDEIIVSPLPVNTNIPTAHIIPKYTSPSMIQGTNASLLRQAQHRGRVEAEIDKTKDTFAKAQLDHTRKQTAAALEIAALNARKARASDEGLTVRAEIHTKYACDSLAVDAKSIENQKKPFGTIINGKRGYEVAKYDVEEYDTTEYEVTEYKSIYD
jgi:hypothetical protein